MKTEIFSTCSECVSWLVNADATGLDYSYPPAVANKRLELIQEGEQKLYSHFKSVSYTGGSDEEFSVSPCECCGSDLYGPRFEFTGVVRSEVKIA